MLVFLYSVEDLLTIKSGQSVITKSTSTKCWTFHPELPPPLALVDRALEVVEPVSDPLLESQVHPPVRLLVDADGEVASLVQQRDSVNVGQLQLKIRPLHCETSVLHCDALRWLFSMEMLALNRNSPISDSFEESFLKQWK